MPPASRTPQHALSDEIRTRYLNYSLSVITSRALPDVRDGLKPSQRRILVAMRGLSLWPDAKFSKSAKICGETMGNYHPHGDLAIYATLVRMAQAFAMRYPLVDGQGNFGSLDGDNAAAMRYTEARLSGIAMELLRELGQDTVDWRPTYDGRAQEPVVLPARFPQLLVNGSSGIAVGMATSIPPHNLGEVTEALLALLANPDVSPKKLAGIVKGPDFPTGGLLLNSHEEILEIYRTGQGVFKIRGEYEVESGGRGKQLLVLTSIPYGVNKSQLVEKIGAHIAGKKVPQLVDVRDESTGEVRVVCELRSGAAPEVAAAYLYKHTDFQSTFPANLTCLVPTRTPGLLRPERLDLKGMLEYYLDFRVAVVRRRFAWELRQLEARIHILRGFAKIFDALDEAIRIIRKSNGKEDAAERLMKRFGLDDVQADAILETKLYKLAKTEIQKLLDELAEKEKDARRIRGILKSKERLAAEVKTELQEVARTYGDDRRTRIGEEVEEVEFDPEAYIVREDAFAVLTRDGRTKRQGSVKTAESIRTREGDAVIAVVAGATTEPIVYLSNMGSAYVMRMADLPASTGHGEPIQTIFKFGDGERAVALFSLDPRFRPPGPARKKKDDPEGPHLLVVTKRGYGFRFSLAAHAEPTTRGGRRYARVGEGDEILGVVPVTGEEAFVTATKGGRVLLAPVEEVPILAGAGRGVILHKVAPGDEVIGFGTVLSRDDAVVVEKSTGGEARITARSYRVASRAGKGFELTKRGEILRVLPRPISVPQFEGNGHARTANGPEGDHDG